jgi:hypothetical protein
MKYFIQTNAYPQKAGLADWQNVADAFSFEAAKETALARLDYYNGALRIVSQDGQQVWYWPFAD